jgi:hypothetical protein
MLIESLSPLLVRFRSREVHLEPGQPVRFSEEDGRKLLARAPGKVRCVTPEPPLQAGWLVVYRDRQGRLRGGCNERECGTVRECRWDDSGWTVILKNGEPLALGRILSVGKTDVNGKLIAAWTVREQGYDGEGARAKQE